VLVDHTPPVPSSPQIANRDDRLPGLFSKSAHARRYRDLIDAFLTDVGGIERCSEVKLSLIRRLAAVVVQAELVESRLMNGMVIDVSQLCTLASTTVRLAQRIGIERVAKGIEPPPTLDAYLNRNGKYGAHDDEELAQ
jgi:hypothetical protein